MKIKLRVDGKEKTYTNDFVKALVFRKALELNKKFTNGLELGEVETFDALIEFVVFAFDNQFTVEEVWEGLNAAQILNEPNRIFNEVLNLGGLAVTPLEVNGESEAEIEGK